jgi:membrane-associated phospholipid phosphatase
MLLGSFSVTALLFAVATLNRPYIDHSLAQFDMALGLSGPELIQLADRLRLIPTLHFIYASAIIQTLFGFAFLAYRFDYRRLHAYLSQFLLCGLLTVVGFALFPAEGTCVQYGLPVPEYYAAILKQLTVLRSGGSFSLEGQYGIVTFPSFHAAGAVLTAAMFYKSRLFPFFAVLNALVVLSAVVIGFHYFADIFAGLALSAVAIAVTSERAAWVPRLLQSWRRKLLGSVPGRTLVRGEHSAA